MTKTVWIALADYSLKYKVSISTLRRRIKNKDVEFQLEEGKYLLVDAPPQATKKLIKRTAQTLAPPQLRSSLAGATVAKPPPIAVKSDRAEVELLLSEIKEAFALVAIEKDEQINLLKGEVADLKTLTRILEDENERLKSMIKDSMSLDQWLKT